MEFKLPGIGKPALGTPYFPAKHQAFIFRASEYVPMPKIAQILKTTEENVRRAAEEMGLPDCNPGNLWLEKGYITIIRRMWHILPYEQLLELLETDEENLAVTLREDDFLDVKLGSKPACEPVVWRELTEEEREKTRDIARIMKTIELDGVPPFQFRYDLPKLELHTHIGIQQRKDYLTQANEQIQDKEPDTRRSIYCKSGNHVTRNGWCENTNSGEDNSYQKS